MIKLRTGYFLTVIALHVVLFGAIYGIIVGASGPTLLFYISADNLFNNNSSILFALCGGSSLIIMGGMVGVCVGIFLFASNVPSVLGITIAFLKKNTFGVHKLFYCALIFLSSLLINMTISLLILTYFSSIRDEPLPLNTWLIIEFWIGLGTIVANIHYIHWFYGYLAQYPEFFHLSKKKSSQPEAQALKILPRYDKRLYKMPKIPDDFTHYTDGELPAELLRQFPIDRE